jgi:SH3-like domain-containing protein
MCPTNEYGEYIRPNKKASHSEDFNRTAQTRNRTVQTVNRNTSSLANEQHITDESLILVIVISCFIGYILIFSPFPKYFSSNQNENIFDNLDQVAFTLTNLNARSEPNNSSNILHVFEKGTILKILDISGEWLKVTPIDSRIKSIVGEAWVFSSFLEKSRIVHTTEFLNARANPNTQAKVLFVFPPDTQLVTVARDNQWYLVFPVDKDIRKQINAAWVHSNFIE